MGDILSDLLGGLFEKLPRRVQIGCGLLFCAVVAVGLILIWMGRI